jgi:prepilin-type N-terminal cleavage/methylation domain-containing protein
MKGYTLIELVMVIVLLAILAGIGVPMMFKTVDAWVFTSKFQDYAVMSSVMAMNRMSREMRLLLNDANIWTATASQITFTLKDVAGNNISVSFNRSGNTLQRGLGVVSPVYDALADNVTAWTLTYYDNFNNTIATPKINPNNTDIRRIDIVFSVLAGSNTLNFDTEVQPQNLMRYSEKFK